jgi:hypothetical protein
MSVANEYPLRRLLVRLGMSTWSDAETDLIIRTEVIVASQMTFLSRAVAAQCSVEELLYILRLRPNVNPSCSNGWSSPLFRAVTTGQLEHVELLCQAGADVYAEWPSHAGYPSLPIYGEPGTSPIAEGVINQVWKGATRCWEGKTQEVKRVAILEYFLVHHGISMGTRELALDSPVGALLYQIRQRVARCGNACHLTLLWFRFCMKHWVAKQVAERIARMVWASRRQELWDLK